MKLLFDSSAGDTMIIHQSVSYHHYLPHIFTYHHHSIEGKRRMDRWMDGWVGGWIVVSTSSSAEVLPSFHVIHDDNRHLYAVLT